jgi:hypothetical protein
VLRPSPLLRAVVPCSFLEVPEPTLGKLYEIVGRSYYFIDNLNDWLITIGQYWLVIIEDWLIIIYYDWLMINCWSINWWSINWWSWSFDRLISIDRSIMFDSLWFVDRKFCVLFPQKNSFLIMQVNLLMDCSALSKMNMNQWNSFKSWEVLLLCLRQVLSLYRFAVNIIEGYTVII